MSEVFTARIVGGQVVLTVKDFAKICVELKDFGVDAEIEQSSLKEFQFRLVELNPSQ